MILIHLIVGSAATLVDVFNVVQTSEEGRKVLQDERDVEIIVVHQLLGPYSPRLVHEQLVVALASLLVCAARVIVGLEIVHHLVYDGLFEGCGVKACYKLVQVDVDGAVLVVACALAESTECVFVKLRSFRLPYELQFL